MAKNTSSSVKAFLGSVEGICLIEEVLRKALKPFKSVTPADADQFAMFMDLTKVYLVVSKACNEALSADLKAQRDFEELKRTIEGNMTPAEVEATLEAHFERKGWGSLDACRSMLFTYLTEEGLSAEQAQEVIENGLPKREARSRQLPVTHKIRKAYGRMEAAMAEAADDLHEALAGSEGDDSGTPGGTTPAQDTSDSEAQVAPDTDDTEKH